MATVSIGTLWRNIIESSVPGTTYGTPLTISSTKETYIPLVFMGNQFISYLLSTGCIQQRSQGIEWGEALRARDIIRPLTNECRFSDSNTKWVCRSNEPVSSLYSFSVAALLNSTNFVLAAPFLKQGTLFLNPRFFLLDRTTARLYVFTYDYSTSPRYYVDFVTQQCTVTLLQPISSSSISNSSSTTAAILTMNDDSDSDTEDENDTTSSSASLESVYPSSSSSTPVWLPQGTGTTTLPAGKTKSWGFILNGPSLRIVAYTDRERRARVWVRGITATIARYAPRPIVSHSQQRLRKINISPPSHLLPGHDNDNLPSIPGGANLESPLFTPYLPSAITSTNLRQHHLTSYPLMDTMNGSSSNGEQSHNNNNNSKPQTPLVKHLQSMRSLAVQQEEENNDTIPSHILPRNIQELLAIPHETLRKYTKETWIISYVDELFRNQDVNNTDENTPEEVMPSNTQRTPRKDKHEATDSTNNDTKASISRSLPLWTTIPENMLITLCHPPAMMELYTTALEMYIKCINESLGFLAYNDQGIYNGTMDDSTIGTSSNNNNNNFSTDLRALRLLVLEPWRLLSDLGIFIPAHQRYIIERCATFVEHLPDEISNIDTVLSTAENGLNNSNPILNEENGLKPSLSKHYRMSARLSTNLDTSNLPSSSSLSLKPVSSSRLFKTDSVSITSSSYVPSYTGIINVPDDSTIFDAQRALVQLQIASAFSAYTTHMERAGEIAGADALAAEFALSLVPRQPRSVGDGQKALLTRSDHHNSYGTRTEESNAKGLDTISETLVYDSTGITATNSSSLPVMITSAVALDVATCEAWAILLSRIAATVHDVFRVPRKVPQSILNSKNSSTGLPPPSPSTHRTPQKSELPVTHRKSSVVSSIGRRSFAREESFLSNSSPSSNDYDHRRESASSIELASALVDWGKTDRVVPRRRASSGDRYVYGTALPMVSNVSIPRSPSTIVSGRRNSDSDISKLPNVNSIRDINALLEGIDSSINDNQERLSVADLLELSSPPQSPDTRRLTNSNSNGPRPVTHSGFQRRETSSSGISRSNPTTTSTSRVPGTATTTASTPTTSPFNDALLRKILEVTNQRLKSLMVTLAVDILTSGRHPLSVLLQRIIASLQSLYGTEVFLRFGIDTNDAIRYLRHDLGPSITRTAKQLREWPKLWLAALNDWGATALYLRPSQTFEQIFQEQASYENLHTNDWDIEINHLVSPSLSTNGSFGTPVSSPAPPPLTSFASPSSSAAAAPSNEVRTAWRYACRITKSLHLSERDIDDICTDAIQTVVFRVLGKSINALYRSMHIEEDTSLRQSYAVLWGMTTTQQDLADELRLDALSNYLPLHSFTHLSTRCSYIIPAAEGSRQYTLQQTQRQQNILGYDISTNVQEIPIMATTSCLPTQALAVLWTSMAVSLRLPLGLLPASVLGKSATNPSANDNTSTTGITGFVRGRSFSNSHNTNGNVNPYLLKQQQQYHEDVKLLVQNMDHVQFLHPVNQTIQSLDKDPYQLNQQKNSTTKEHTSPIRFAFPEYMKGTIDNPASLVALQPAIAIFSLFAQYHEPNMKLRVLMATVDTLCRCVTAHRTGIAASIAHIRKLTKEHEHSDASSERDTTTNPLTSSSYGKPTTAELIAASLAATNIASLLETAHINADDLLGLLCHIAIHAGVPNLISDIAMVADYVSEEMMIERPGFFLTSLQAAVAYAVTDDIQQRLTCGHCEGKSNLPVTVRCRACGRQLCSLCDKLLHSLSDNPSLQASSITIINDTKTKKEKDDESSSNDDDKKQEHERQERIRMNAIHLMKIHVRTPAPITILSSSPSASQRQEYLQKYGLNASYPKNHHSNNGLSAANNNNKNRLLFRRNKYSALSTVDPMIRRRIIGSTSDMDPDSQRLLTSLVPLTMNRGENGGPSTAGTVPTTTERIDNELPTVRNRTVSTSALVWPSVSVSLNDGTLEGISKEELYHWWHNSHNIPSNSPTAPLRSPTHKPKEQTNGEDSTVETTRQEETIAPNSVGYTNLAATANEILTSPRTSRYRSTSTIPHNIVEN